MDPYLTSFLSFKRFDVVGASPLLKPVPVAEQLSLLISAVQRYTGASRLLIYTIDRTIALLRSIEVALRAQQPEQRGGPQGGMSGTNLPADAHCAQIGAIASSPARFELVADICPRCQVQLALGARLNGHGAGHVEPLPVEDEVVKMVEDALRRLFDFAHLGESPLASWKSVQRLTAKPQSGAAQTEMQPREAAMQPILEPVTHVERGKALYLFLVQAVKLLRPEGKVPERLAVPTREWYHYLILHDSYVEGELNRNIMARLYIGEGTFNRERRKALRSVAKILIEMEREARRE